MKQVVRQVQQHLQKQHLRERHQQPARPRQEQSAMEQREPQCQQDDGRKHQEGEYERQNSAACETAEAFPPFRDGQVQAADSVTRTLPCADFQRVPAPRVRSSEKTSWNGEVPSPAGREFNKSDDREDFTENHLPSHQRRCAISFSLPPSQFLLGFQSFSIQDRYSVGTPHHRLEDHRELVRQWLQQQQTIHQFEEQQHPGAGRQQDIYGQQQAQWQLCRQQWQQRQVHRQQRHRHDRQWRQQQHCWHQQQAEEGRCTNMRVLPVTLHPAPLSTKASSMLHAEEEAEMQRDTGRQQHLLHQPPQKELEEGVSQGFENSHLPAFVGQAEKWPSAFAGAEGAASPQKQQPHPPEQQQSSGGHLSSQQQHRRQWKEGSDDGATNAVRTPAVPAAGGRGKAGTEESVRHQVAGRFQMIKKLRHPHLCAYTHMLRKGRRVYVVSEYWSLSLADVLNQQLQSQARNRREDFGTAYTPYCRCFCSHTNNSSSGNNTISSPDSSDRSNGVSVSGSRRVRGGGDGCCSSCCRSGILPLLPEEFLRRIVQQILSALEYLNSHGIVHARLSLSAIRFDAEGNVRVADWGLQHLTGHGRCTSQTQVHPPLPFVPPETLLLGPLVAAAPAVTSAAIFAAVAAPRTAAPADAAARCTAARSASGVGGSNAPAAASSAGAADVLRAVAAVPATVTPETFSSGEPMATGCSPNSSSGDVFAVGIILLHLLQGPPRTPLPHALLETLRRQTAPQQQRLQQPAELLHTCVGQTKREAEAGTQQQQHGQPIRGCPEQQHEEAGKHTGEQHHMCSCPQGTPTQEEQQQLAPQQQQEGHQKEQQADGEHQQQGFEKIEKREPADGKGNESSSGDERDSKARETLTQSVKGRLVCEQPSEGEKGDPEQEEVLQPEADAYFWDEWEGYERKKMARDCSRSPCSSNSICSSQSLFEVNGLLQEPMCCLRLLRHVERVALLLLYVHCGYGGLQKSLSSLVEARQRQTHAWTDGGLSGGNRVSRDAGNYSLGQSPARAAAARNEVQYAATWAAEGEAALGRGSVTRDPLWKTTIGSCIGQNLKQFVRQQQRVLLARMRGLVRGPSSVIFQAHMYERLLEIVSQHLGVEPLQQPPEKMPVQQKQPAQEELLLKTAAAHTIPVLSARHERVAWQVPQQDPGRQVRQQRHAAPAARGTEERSDAVSVFKQAHSFVRSSAVEDVLLESVLSAAVDWLSGTHIWPAHPCGPLQHTSTADSQCFFDSDSSTSKRGAGTMDLASTGATRVGGETRSAASTAETAHGTSQELCDFLRMCLALSPNDRPTPAEALNCAWLRQRHGATTQQPPPFSQTKQQRQPDQMPPQQQGQGLPRNSSEHSPDGNPTLTRRGTKTRAKNAESALWCPQAAASAVALLQQLQAGAALRSSLEAGVSGSDFEGDDEDGRSLSVNLRTLLQQQYEVEVEEVFYWWQLLGRDVHATLSSMGAFHPVSDCLRLPLASLLCTETAATASVRPPPTVGTASFFPAAAATGLLVPSAPVEIDGAAAVERSHQQEETLRRLPVSHGADGVFWTHCGGACAASSNQPTAGASTRGNLGAQQQRWRVPFLLPFADIWGQLHGAGVSKDSNESGRTNSSSSSNSNSVTKSRSSSGSKEESLNDISGTDSGSCSCTQGERWVPLSSHDNIHEPTPGRSDAQQRSSVRCSSNSRQGEAQEVAKVGAECNCDMAASALAAEDCSAVTTYGFEKHADLFPSKGEGSAFPLSSAVTECLTVQNLMAKQDSAAPEVVKDTEGPWEPSGGIEDGGPALVNVAEGSSFFACGLQEESRNWTNTGFFWKEGDARIRGVEVLDVVRALHEADRVPVSRAKEIRPPCIYARQRHFLYQRLRVRHFRLLLAQLPTSGPCLLQEAAVDIPPLLRPQIWAALLHLNYAAEVAAGPFLFNQLVLEAQMVPALGQLETVKFFGCHEYHDVLGSEYGSRMLRRLLQAFFVYAASPSVPHCTSRASPVDSKLPFSQQSEVAFRSPYGPPPAALESPQEFRAPDTSDSRLPRSTPSPQTGDHYSFFIEATESVFSGIERSSDLYGEDGGLVSSTEEGSCLFFSKEPRDVFPVRSQVVHAAEHAFLSVRGLDALAAPFLLLYENHPQLALLSLQRFLLRHKQQRPLLISTPTDAASTSDCQVERRNQQNSASGATVAAAGRTEAVGGMRAAPTRAGRRPTETLQNQVHCYSQLLAFVDPVVAAHLTKRIGLNPEMYVVPWLLTFFSHTLELPQLYLLWDVSLLRPPGFELFVAVSLVHCLRVPLLRLGVDDELAALALLQNASAFVHIPALSAAAVALQEATPPSIFSSRIELLTPTQPARRASSCAGAAPWRTLALSPSPESATFSGTQRTHTAASSRAVLPQEVPQQAQHQQPTQQYKIQRHKQETHRQRQHWRQQQQRHRHELQAEKDVGAFGHPRASLLPLSSAFDTSDLTQKQECTNPAPECNAGGDMAAGISLKPVADAEQPALETDPSASCRYKSSMSVAQRFYIGGTETPENADELAETNEIRHDEEVDTGSDINWLFAENSEAELVSQRPGAVDDGLKEQRLETLNFPDRYHVIQHEKEGGSQMTTGCTRKSRHGSKDRSGAAAAERFEESNNDEIGKLHSAQSDWNKDDDGDAELQSSRGNPSQILEVRQGMQDRAWDFVAAAIKGPALMLLGPPRKVHRQAEVLKSAETLRTGESNSARPLTTDEVTTGRALGQRRGPAKVVS